MCAFAQSTRSHFPPFHQSLLGTVPLASLPVQMTVKNMPMEGEHDLGDENANGSTMVNGVLSKAKVGTIELGDVTPHNIKLLRRLNQVIFPVSYNDKFYKDVLESGPLAKLAYYNDIMVGAVCCRVDTTDPNARRLYIMTLGCLASYRRLGIGSEMVQYVLDYVTMKDTNFDSIFLHVQVNNQDAIEFYQKFGFEIVETRKNYYKRIEPADAHVLSKCLKMD